MKVSGVLSAIAASACLAQASPVAVAADADADKRELNFGGLGPVSGQLGSNPVMDAVQQGVAGFFAGGDAVLNGPGELIRQAMVRISNGEGRSNGNGNGNGNANKANSKRETNLGGLGPLGGALGGGALGGGPADALQQGVAGLFAGGDAVLNGPGDIFRQASGQVAGNDGRVKARAEAAQANKNA